MTQAPTKQRSPNYPSIGLVKALEQIRTLHKKEGRTLIGAEVAAKDMGYKSLSGPARSAIAALRQYGLIEQQKGGVKVSDRGLTIAVRSPGTPEYEQAVREAALEPDIIAQLMETHSTASDEALRHHLLRDRHFTMDGASKFAEVFREALSLAKLDSLRYDGGVTGDEEKGSDASDDGEGSDTSIKTRDGKTVLQYKWPLSKNVEAELKLTGTEELTADDFDNLTDYLNVVRRALGLPKASDPNANKQN